MNKDVSALHYIQQALSRAISPRILGIQKSKQAWDTLQNEYKGTEKVISIKL